ncbi:MAG: hypothetical protein DWQ19_12545 [Crenarchaeota archaeon]|nr:MAG: hypothetical protein DWQ19_12545 [Thermoproteota archaeon]
MTFPPSPLFPTAIDSDRTLFLVYNTSEAQLASDNLPWSQEIVITPVAADKEEIWADNGFANISGELFYYDSVEKDSNGKVFKFKQCARNLGGSQTKLNLKGTWVRGFVVAEHHNQIVDTVLSMENFIGINFSEDTATLDWRIRNLAAEPIGDDDFQCPNVTLEFNIISSSTSGAIGTVAEYNLIIDGFFKTFVLDFGDGNFTTSSQSGTHTYAPNAKIDPVVTVSNDNCQVVQTATVRDDPSLPEPDAVDEPFEIDVPEVPDFPALVIPDIEVPSTTLTLPPIQFPCELGIGPIGSIGDLPSLIMVEDDIPSIITISGIIDIPSEITITPVDIPSIISITPVDIPSIIEFGSLPAFPSIIEFGPVTAFPSIITFGPFPDIPSTIDFGPLSIPSIINVDFPSVISITDVVFPSLISVTDDIPAAIPVTDDIPTAIPVTDDLPSVIMVDDDIPSVVEISVDDDIPTTIPVTDSLPSEIMLLDDLPSTISLIEDIPDTISVDDDIPDTITVNDDIPASIIVNDSIPSSINLNGDLPSIISVDEDIPDTISLLGSIPETISVDWGTPPTIPVTFGPCNCTVEVQCPSASYAAQARAAELMANAEFSDPFTDPELGMQLEASDLGIPSEIKIIPPTMPDIKVVHEIPEYITLAVPEISDIKIIGPEVPIPSEIKVTSETTIPSQIELKSELPQSILLDVSGLPSAISVEFPEEFPTIQIEGDIPKTIQVVGIPDSIELKGHIPSEININITPPEDLEIPLVYKGGPLPVEFVLPTPTGQDGSKRPCFALVPCGEQ